MKKILWFIGIVFLSLSLQAQAKGNKVSPKERMQEWCQRDDITRQASILDAVHYYTKKGLFIPELQKPFEKKTELELSLAHSIFALLSDLCKDPNPTPNMLNASMKRSVYLAMGVLGERNRNLKRSLITKDQKFDDDNNFWF